MVGVFGVGLESSIFTHFIFNYNGREGQKSC